MEGTQGHPEHRHIHLGTVLRAEADRQDLDEAHTSRPMHGFADSSAGDNCRHAVVHQTGHHVTSVVRRLAQGEPGQPGPPELVFRMSELSGWQLG
jgi:hypothetical protein